MASVQELILAAKSGQPRSALAELVNSYSGGYDQGIALKDRRTDIAFKLLQQKQIEQEMLQQKEMQDEIKKELAAEQEINTLNLMRGVGEAPNISIPEQKLKKKITQDAKGNYTRTFETIEPKDTTPKSYESVLVDKYNRGEITFEQLGELKAKSQGISPTLSYNMEKDKEKKVLEAKARVIPGYESTGEVQIDDVSARKLREGVSEFETFSKDLERYKKLIGTYGTSEPTNRKVQGEMKALSKSLQLKIKNIAQLGVLSGSDIPFIEEPIPGPGPMKTKEGMLGAINSTQESMRSTIETNLKLNGYRRSGGLIGTETAGSSGLSDAEAAELAELEKKWGDKK